MNSFKDLLIEYLTENKDKTSFDVNYSFFGDYSDEDVTTVFEELISTRKIEGYVDRDAMIPTITVTKINWNHFQRHL